MSALLDLHHCGCDHLRQSCDRCWGLLSPTTEAALQGRINFLVGHGDHDEAAAAIDRREEQRKNYTLHFRPVRPAQAGGQ